MPVALSYRRYLGWGVTLAAVAFGLLWVFLLADRPAHSDPTTFFSTLLDAITQARPLLHRREWIHARSSA